MALLIGQFCSFILSKIGKEVDFGKTLCKDHVKSMELLTTGLSIYFSINYDQ